MVARKPTAEEGGQKKTDSKADKPTPVKKPAPEKQTKPVKEKPTKPTPSKKIHKGKVMKVHKEKRPSTQPQDDTSANVVRDTLSPAYAKTGADIEKSDSEGDTKILNVDEERGKNVSNIVTLEERVVELDEGQAGSDPGNTLESQPPLDEDPAGSNPEQCHLFLDNSPSSLGTLSSLKNHDDAFTFGDQFIDDKLTEEEPCKANVKSKVESMPKHAAFYEALEASMDRENREEFVEGTAKSHKRRCDDQDPPPPPPKDSDQNKKKRHDSNTSALKLSQAQTSSTWKTSDTREAPSSSSKQKTAPNLNSLLMMF
nr:hypothetical protein [Tanacetum cinerariifolium]